MRAQTPSSRAAARVSRKSRATEPQLGEDTEQLARTAWARLQELVLGHERRKEVCELLELSFVRVKALRWLAGEPATLRQLAARLTCDPPYTTVVVDDLEARGLVARQPSLGDRRAKLVTLTPAGAAAAARAEEILAAPPPGLAGLSAQQLRSLAALLERVLAADRLPAGRPRPGDAQSVAHPAPPAGRAG